MAGYDYHAWEAVFCQIYEAVFLELKFSECNFSWEVTIYVFFRPVNKLKPFNSFDQECFFTGLDLFKELNNAQRARSE